MSKQALVWIGLTVGSTVGGLVPLLWGGDLVSFTGIFLSAAGGLAGIWLGFTRGE